MTWDSIKRETLCVVEQFVSLLPDAGKLSGIRTAFWRRRLKAVGDRFAMASAAKIFGADAIAIGHDVAVGRGTMIDASDGGTIDIGNGVAIGPYCVLRAADHGFDDPAVPIRLQGHVSGTIVIEDDVWLGSHVVVTRNVRIGRGAVIGAHSVVTRSIPADVVAAGVPARVLSRRGDTVQAGAADV